MAPAESTSAPAKQPFLLYAVAGAFLLLVLWNRATLYLQRRRLVKEHGCQPLMHQLNKEPLFGLDMVKENVKVAKERRFLETSRGRFQKMGVTTFGTKILTRPMIVTIEPENIKTVLSLKFKDYSLGSRKRDFTAFLGKGIFNSDGEDWAFSRHLLRPNFARDQVADLEAFEHHMKLLLKAIPRDGSTVDLQDLFFRLTIDSATGFLFNHSTNSLRMVDQDEETNEDAIFAKAFNTAQSEIVKDVRLGELKYFRSHKAHDEAVRICRAYANRFVDGALRWHEAQKASPQKEEKYVFLHELVKQTQDKQRLSDELMNILLAGRDTTASLLSNMFFELAKRPEIWAKLRAEVAQLGGRPPTYEELRNLKYVKWCLNESLRTHPVVPGNGRLAIRDTVLPLGGGPKGDAPLLVKKGTLVGYSPYSMHRRTDLYGPDAEEYRPERWENLRPGWEYLPFNGGPRICLGQQYALTEASYVLVRLVQEFKACESRDSGPWVEGLTLTLCSGNGTKVAMIPA